MRRDFNRSPFIVIWEVTRACQLHCLHCRAEAQRHRDPGELSTAEGKRLIDEIAGLDKPLLVFTGGDPLEREDLFELIEYGTKQGLKVSITPSATPKVTHEAIAKAKSAGLERWAFSLDGSTAEIHDRFRGTKGSYDRTIYALNVLRELQIPIQLNTTVSRYNLTDLQKIAELAAQYDATLWSVFFLVPTGRARAKDMISAEEHEQVVEWLYELSQSSSFDVKTTEAPYYRRVVLQHRKEQGADGMARPIHDPKSLRAAMGVNDGNGFVFISHLGDVSPSGFLPLVAGNVRVQSLAEIYRESPMFQNLRNPDLLKGKCGICEFRKVCGGSRAKAFSMTGDYMESDPSCVYQPQVLSHTI
ncbi:TIGR04053 family radical SAM/SPASM domain-containing protein [Alicyclobacillus tolerans]|uniref:TIGR04053 family radical SAM/SPASM domain-containing protein n=1 Tax=Alicyclobacillus tolerans TaxID=90970 RepID=UPI001F013F41|nr:TIGR04053 family radical SAM/SPASM domain-containing protein [Alicyclobacillus tolerans]MCF8566383.1 TIGR04053 family radical SAM/SPASM domain-containing protein [Alicyclobacillus tolerans]